MRDLGAALISVTTGHEAHAGREQPHHQGEVAGHPHEQERRAVYRALLAGADSPPETVAIQVITDALPAAFASVQLLVDQLGTVKRLPPTVFIEPDYLLVGPVVVLGPEGLSELQVQQLREIIIVVDDSVRDEVAKHFYGHQ